MVMTTLAKVAVAASALAASASAYDASAVGKVRLPCLSSLVTCNGTATLNGQTVTLPCAAASGKVPLGVPKLPLYMEGDYDLCDTFHAAHYCTIRTGMLVLPTGVKPDGTPELFFLGDLRLNQCVSRQCTAEHLHDSIKGQADSLTNLVTRLLPKSSAEGIKQLEKIIMDGLVVNCLEDPPTLDATGWFVAVVLMLLLVCMVGSTLADVYGSKDSISVVRWFSARHNVSRLLDASKGTEFAVFNGMRFFSMIWIITGHTSLNSLAPPVVNPTALQRFLQSYSVAYIRGAEYAVDTFFFLSGFLATFSLVKQLRKRPLTPRMYGMFIVSRWVRLTPPYAAVMFWYWKILPVMYYGPLWDEQYQSMGSANTEACDKHWWTNMLYIQNLYPFSGSAMCAPWSWYLANDFQFFLLVPFLVTAFLWGRKRGMRSLMFGPCLVLVLVQLVSVFALFEHYGMNGSLLPLSPAGLHYFDQVYEKPWTRVTPYALGVLLSLWHTDRSETRNGPVLSRASASALFVGGVSGIFGLISAHYFQWRCTEDAQTCDIWGGTFQLGLLAVPNWSQAGATWFYTFSWLFWTLSLGAVTFVFIDGHDPLQVRWLLAHHMLVVPARLTYSAYLVHMPIMFAFAFSQSALPSFHGWQIVVQSIAFVVIAYALALFIYLVIEKPSMNAYAAFMLRSTPPDQHETDHATLHRRISRLGDVDSESVLMASPLRDDEVPDADAADDADLRQPMLT